MLRRPCFLGKPKPNLMPHPLLILDLDETLIHARDEPWTRVPDLVWESYHVRFRPFVREFIGSVSRHFELAVWTSSTADYAAAITEALLGDMDLRFLWARERCTLRFDPELQGHHWVKKLSKLRKLGISLDQVLIVDDSPEKLRLNYGNLVPVTPWETAARPRGNLPGNEPLGERPDRFQ